MADAPFDNTYELSAPIMTHGGNITTLTLNAPKGRAFIKHGMPYSIVREGDDDNVRTEFRFMPKIMFKFLADMTGLNEIELDDLPGCDVQPLFWKVVAVIGERPTKSSA